VPALERISDSTQSSPDVVEGSHSAESYLDELVRCPPAANVAPTKQISSFEPCAELICINYKARFPAERSGANCTLPHSWNVR
jgi:hypothetical protein